MFRTEYEFTLPMGLLDADGDLHREGVMRLATAADEIHPLRDERVQRNPAYLSVIVLSRVVTRLGSVDPINPAVIERLFAADLEYLQDLYNTINQVGLGGVEATCPECRAAFPFERSALGSSSATPSIS